LLSKTKGFQALMKHTAYFLLHRLVTLTVEGCGNMEVGITAIEVGTG
jgi:hypothetical protein